MWGRREQIVGNGEVLGGKQWGKTPYGEPQHQLWHEPPFTDNGKNALIVPRHNKGRAQASPTSSFVLKINDLTIYVGQGLVLLNLYSTHFRVARCSLWPAIAVHLAHNRASTNCSSSHTRLRAHFQDSLSLSFLSIGFLIFFSGYLSRLL